MFAMSLPQNQRLNICFVLSAGAKDCWFHFCHVDVGPTKIAPKEEGGKRRWAPFFAMLQLRSSRQVTASVLPVALQRPAPKKGGSGAALWPVTGWRLAPGACRAVAAVGGGQRQRPTEMRAQRQHSVRSTSTSEAKRLLCMKAFGNADSTFPQGLGIDDLVEICGGIPLVLELVGSKLKECMGDVSACQETVKFLKESLVQGEEEVSERVVDVVYNSLGETYKEAFLDIVCFFHNWERRIVGNIVGNVQLRALENAALVKISQGWHSRRVYTELDKFIRDIDAQEGILNVHDIVRARGKKLSQGNRIMSVQCLKDAIRDFQVLQKIKGIWLPFNEHELSIEAAHLDLMNTSLRVLFTEFTQINGICKGNFENLRYVEYLAQYSDKILPMNPAKLQRSAVLKFGSVGDDVCELPESLKVIKLHLKNSPNLPVLLESFEKLSSLQQLDLSWSEINILPSSFGHLNTLHFLTLEYTASLTKLPENFGSLTNLEGLSLANCRSLQSLPESFGELRSLCFLELQGCAIKTLPQNFGNLSRLQNLNLEYCQYLTTLPASFGNLFSLKNLNLNYFHSLSLPENFGQLQALSCLRFTSCSRLTFLPQSFGNLFALERLDLSFCGLVTLAANFGQLKSLKVLNLAYCSNLSSLPESFGNLSSLEKLRLSGCDNLLSLPDSFGQLVNMKELNMRKCEKLSNLPEKFGQLNSLEFLKLEDCKGLERLCGDIGCLSSLVALHAGSCPRLEGKSIDMLVEIESLMFLDIDQSPLLIERWKQVMQHHLLLVGYENYYWGGEGLRKACVEAIRTALFSCKSKYAAIDDEGRITEWSPACLPDAGAKMAILATICDLTSSSNSGVLKTVLKNCTELASQGFQIIYVQVGELWRSNENIIAQTLHHLAPSTQALIPSHDKTNKLFGHALYTVLDGMEKPWSRVHTFTATLISSINGGGKKMMEKVELQFPRENDWQGMTDVRGGFRGLFQYLDIIVQRLRREGNFDILD